MAAILKIRGKISLFIRLGRLQKTDVYFKIVFKKKVFFFKKKVQKNILARESILKFFIN